MLPLSGPNGTYPVGATTFLVPIEPPITAGSVKVPGRDGTGLSLEEVAFTAYYPANVSSEKRSKGLRWMSYPLPIEIDGYKQFLGGSRWLDWLLIKPLVYLYGRFLRIPVYPKASLLRIPDRVWPLVVFSHGLGGNRTAYSQFCTTLAACGYVVLAMEHRDGTATACVSRANNKSQPILYINESEVMWDNKPEGALPLRTEQLAIRHHEIYTTYTTFSKLVSGDTNVMIKTVEGDDPRETWSKSPIRLNDVCLAGHSFGGCTVLSILSSHLPKDRTYSRIPISHALVLDPWLEPLPTPGPTPIAIDSNPDSSSVKLSLNGAAEEAPKKSADSLPRMLVINSEEFTCWSEHFQRLEGIVKEWSPEAKLITLVKSVHVTFSDFPLLPLIRNKKSVLLLNIFTRLSVAFMGNELIDALDKEKVLDKAPEEVVVGHWKDGSDKKRFIGSPGEVLVHQ